MQSRKPTLSVIMPNYNHGRFIPEALQAILDQSYPASEILIIDDASTDNSAEIIEQFARRDPRIRFTRNEYNRGVIYNVSRLLEQARGDYVVGCACDDRILPGFFEKSLALLAQHPQAGLCSTLSWILGPMGEDRGLLPGLIVSPRPAYLPPDRVRRLFRTLGGWFQGNTVIYRRAALLESGGFIASLRSYSDVFAATVVALKHGCCFIPEPLAAWRQLSGTYSLQVRTNPDAERQMVRSAVDLMLTRYRSLFPKEYARLWQRDMAFDYDRRLNPKWAGYLRSGMPPPPSQHSLLHGLRQVAARLCSGGVLAYLLLKHRPWWAVRRRWHRLTSPAYRRHWVSPIQRSELAQAPTLPLAHSTQPAL